MKKSLFVLAIAGAFAAPVAMADVTIYGAANASLDLTKNGVSAANVSATKVSSNESHIGFKGAEDLGGGLAAAWQVESSIGLDGSTSKLAGRNSYVGIAGGFGTIALGTHDTPYKLSTRGLDVFADTLADNRNTSSLHNIRLGNVLAYISPKIADSVTVIGAYVAGAETATTGQTKGSAVSLAAMYGAGPVNAALAYQTVTSGSTGSGNLDLTGLGVLANTKLTGTKLGAGFAQDMFAVNVVVERASTQPAGGATTSTTNLYVGGKFNLSASDAVKAAYGKQGSASGAANGGKQMSVGFEHGMSKMTSVYALYTKVSNDTSGRVGLGQSMDGEISGAQAAVGTNSTPSAFSVGVKHSF